MIGIKSDLVFTLLRAAMFLENVKLLRKARNCTLLMEPNYNIVFNYFFIFQHVIFMRLSLCE